MEIDWVGIIICWAIVTAICGALVDKDDRGSAVIVGVLAAYPLNMLLEWISDHV